MKRTFLSIGIGLAFVGLSTNPPLGGMEENGGPDGRGGETRFGF